MTDDSGNELEIKKNKLDKDLGIIVGNDLKWTGHIYRMVRKANIIQGMLKKTFVSMDLGLWKDFYVSMVYHTYSMLCKRGTLTWMETLIGLRA